MDTGALAGTCSSEEIVHRTDDTSQSEMLLQVGSVRVSVCRALVQSSTLLTSGDFDSGVVPCAYCTPGETGEIDLAVSAAKQLNMIFLERTRATVDVDANLLPLMLQLMDFLMIDLSEAPERIRAECFEQSSLTSAQLGDTDGHINPQWKPEHSILHPDGWKPLLLHQTLGSNQVFRDYYLLRRAGITEHELTEAITERLRSKGIPEDWKLVNFLQAAAGGKDYESHSWSRIFRSAHSTRCIATPVKNHWKPWLQSLVVMGRPIPKAFIDWLSYDDGENIHHVAVTVAKMARVWLTYDPYEDYDPFDADARPDPRDDPDWTPQNPKSGYLYRCAEKYAWTDMMSDGFIKSLNAAKIGPQYRISGGPSTTDEDQVDPQSFFVDVDWDDAEQGCCAAREGLVEKILEEMTAERRKVFGECQEIDGWDQELLAEQKSVLAHVDYEVYMYYWRRMQEFVDMFVNELSTHAEAKQAVTKAIARCRPQSAKKKGVADFTPEGSRYDWDPRRDSTAANEATSYEDWMQSCISAGVEPDLCSQTVVGFYWEYGEHTWGDVDTKTVHIPGLTTSLHRFSWDIAAQAAEQGSYLHAFSGNAFDDYCRRTRYSREAVTPADTLVPFIGKAYKQSCTVVTMHFEPRTWQRLRWVQMFQAEQDLASNAWSKLEESFRELQQMLDEQSYSWREDPDILTSGLLRDADDERKELYCLMCTVEFCNFWYMKSEAKLPTRALYSGAANDASLQRVMDLFVQYAKRSSVSHSPCP